MKNSACLSSDRKNDGRSLNTKENLLDQKIYNSPQSQIQEQIFQDNDLRMSNQNIFVQNNQLAYQPIQTMNAETSQRNYGKKHKKQDKIKEQISSKTFKKYKFSQIMKILLFSVGSLIFVLVLVVQTQYHLKNQNQIKNLKNKVENVFQKINQNNYRIIQNFRKNQFEQKLKTGVQLKLIQLIKQQQKKYQNQNQKVEQNSKQTQENENHQQNIKVQKQILVNEPKVSNEKLNSIIITQNPKKNRENQLKSQNLMKQQKEQIDKNKPKQTKITSSNAKSDQFNAINQQTEIHFQSTLKEENKKFEQQNTLAQQNNKEIFFENTPQQHTQRFSQIQTVTRPKTPQPFISIQQQGILQVQIHQVEQYPPQNYQRSQSLQQGRTNEDPLKESNQNLGAQIIQVFTVAQISQAIEHPALIEQALTPLESQQKSGQNSFDQQLTCNEFKVRRELKYGQLYAFASQHTQFRLNSNVEHFGYQSLTDITQTKYSQAIDLMKLIHNVDSNGNLNVKDTPCQKGSEIETMLQSTMKSQTQRLNSEHQIDKYHSKQLRFCIVSNSYRNAQNGLLYRNIDSILQQDYTNYHVVYTDDHSPDRTGEVVADYLKQKQVPEGKFKVKINAKKVGMMENIYNAITNDCELGEIAVMLDGDDSFIGRNVLSLLNAVYQKQKVALMWNNFLQINSNLRASMGFSRDFYSNIKLRNAFRQMPGMISSHLKSFYVDLFRKIKVTDLKEDNGQFFGGASDTAMMLAMLEMANPKIKYVPQIVYEYRFDTGQVGMTVNRSPQLRALSKIGKTTPYDNLSDFSFIDKSISEAVQF